MGFCKLLHFNICNGIQINYYSRIFAGQTQYDAFVVQPSYSKRLTHLVKHIFAVCKSLQQIMLLLKLTGLYGHGGHVLPEERSPIYETLCDFSLFFKLGQCQTCNCKFAFETVQHRNKFLYQIKPD